MNIHVSNILILLLTIVPRGSVSSNCSSRLCVFKELNFKGELEVDCSDLLLGCIPAFNDTVVKVNLSNNRLSHLYGTFSPHLWSLDLSNNPLRKVNSSTLRSLTSLEHLGLRNTSLEKWNLTTNPFKALQSLTSLDIQYNFNSGKFPYDIFSVLRKLNSLYINGYPDGFSGPMAKLMSLKVLLMSGITGKCDIPVLHEKYFQHIEGLENLTITQCGINQIYKDSISKFINLKHFDFSHNKQLSFAVLPNVTFDLNKTDIKNLLFNEIHCTHGLGTEIYLGDFQNIQNADLSLVSANNNRLELIDERIFSRLPFVWNIQYVSLSNNRLSAGKYIYRVVFLSSLKRIDVSYQDRRDDPDADDYNHCDDTINKRQHVQQMRLSENQPKFKRSTNNDKENGVLIPGKLETVYCKYSKQKHEIPEITVLNDNKVKHLHLQGNTFYKWIGPIRNAAKLEYVDLSSNLCSYISPKFLTYVYNLKILNVSDNVLGYSLQDDTRGKIFKNLKMLKILNLASNKIQILPKLIFHNLDSLEVLNLSLNLLRNIDFEFMHMRKLRIFDISNNQIPSLSRNFQRGLTAMSDHLKVNITNNPLECNCEDIQFWKWLSKSTFVTYSSSQTCWNGKFKDIFDHYNLNVGVEIMEKHCASYIELISVVSSCIFVIFIFILTAIIYRYRWKLRYLYYTTRNNHRGYTNIQRENPNDEFLFDCFVSYADEDRKFAFHDMMKNLEGSNDIKLCFHQRDFIPGFEIGENITNAIHRSRKTICVISSNYLNSHWCKFEFNMARMENIYSRNGNNSLMFILYHPLRSDQIPLDMMYMMESQSYIEYPNEEQDRMAFWVKLRDAITI